MTRAIAPDSCLDYPTGKSVKTCQALRAKIFRFSEHPNQIYTFRCPVPPTGAARDRHGRGTGCGGRGSVADVRHQGGRPRRVVLTPRRWCQVRVKQSLMTVAKKPGHRGEHGAAVKTIVQGRSGVSGEPVVTMLVCFFILHTRLRVRRASGFPCSLCFGGTQSLTSRAHRAARMLAYVYLHLSPAGRGRFAQQIG